MTGVEFIGLVVFCAIVGSIGGEISQRIRDRFARRREARARLLGVLVERAKRRGPYR